jgi:hypothetical protein
MAQLPAGIGVLVPEPDRQYVTNSGRIKLIWASPG